MPARKPETTRNNKLSNKEIVSAETRGLIESFFRRNEIRSLTVERDEGITSSIEISNINILLERDAREQDSEYVVDFKLQFESSDIFRYLKSISIEPGTSVELTGEAQDMDADYVNLQVREFLENINERVKSARKEEKVQNIKYVGNTFILNNATVFKVLSDEGEGRLNIEVLSEVQPMDAVLTASGLLDGLYLGSIKLVE